jgi:hypothetical protein
MRIQKIMKKKKKKKILNLYKKIKIYKRINKNLSIKIIINKKNKIPIKKLTKFNNNKINKYH